MISTRAKATSTVGSVLFGLVAVLTSPVWAPLVGWTLFLWISRIRNVLGDDDLDGFGVAWRVGAAAVFLVLSMHVGSAFGFHS